LALDFGYWIVSPETAAERPRAAAFRAWLLSEARQHETPQTVGTPIPGRKRRPAVSR
jgi:hypothetical protein